MNNKYSAHCTGFWNEPLELMDDDEEYTNTDLDAFDVFGFDFMEGDHPWSEDEIEEWVDILLKENKSLKRREAQAIIKSYTAYDFLHGDCNLFAQYLHETYGYKLGAVFETDDDENYHLVHMFCYNKQDDGRTDYIDVRGKCDDFDLFMKEFYDVGLWADDDYTIYNEYDKMPDNYKVSGEDAWRILAAACMDYWYSFYSP